MGKIAIIGLGLIGSSLGLAIRRAQGSATEVVGYDHEPENVRSAQKIGAISGSASTIRQTVQDANLIIVATPIISMEGIFDEMAPHLRPGTVVTDTASTKASVIRWANEHLPRSVHFVGGHPMAGKEQSGPLAAEATLFEGRPYVIIPSVNAGVGAVNAVIGLAQAIGAQPSFLDAEEHDAYAAAISHVPLVSSIALFNLARTSAAWPELAGMAGPGFRDLTRLASGEPAMAHDICLTNKENILHWIDRYTAELGRIRELIQGSDDEALFRTIAEAQMERESFLANPPRREEPGAQTEIPSAGEAFMGMMGGILWQNRATDMQKTLDERRERELREDRLRRRD